MIELVILDCDGVLVDSEPISNGALAEVLGEIGLPTTAEECMRLYMGRSAASTWALVAERLGHPLPAGTVERYAALVLRRLAAVRPVEGVVEALDAITLPTCVASSGSHARMAVTLGAAGLRDRFAGRIFSAVDVARGKPFGDLFLHAAASLGAEPARCVVVEDSLPGVAAAQAAGMPALGYAAVVSPGQLAAAGARPFTAMRELPRLLTELDADSPR